MENCNAFGRFGLGGHGGIPEAGIGHGIETKTVASRAGVVRMKENEVAFEKDP